jgi:hypothetical protein
MDMWLLLLYTSLREPHFRIEMRDEDSCVLAAKELTAKTHPKGICINWDGIVLYFENGKQTGGQPHGSPLPNSKR